MSDRPAPIPSMAEAFLLYMQEVKDCLAKTKQDSIIHHDDVAYIISGWANASRCDLIADAISMGRDMRRTGAYHERVRTIVRSETETDVGLYDDCSG